MIKYSQFPDISRNTRHFPGEISIFPVEKSLKSPSSTRLPMRARSAASFAARARRQRRSPRHRGRRLAVARWGWIDRDLSNKNGDLMGTIRNGDHLGIIQGSFSSQTSDHMDKWSGERSQRERERESQKRKKIKAYEKVEKSPNTVFPTSLNPMKSHLFLAKSNELTFCLG